MKCWCGEANPYCAPLHGGCDGTGASECLCGGDLCICHNHGTVECDGCPECNPTVVIEEYDLYCHDSNDDGPDGSPPASDRRAPAPASSLTK